MHGHQFVAQLMLSEGLVEDIDNKNSDGFTALHLVASNSGNPALVPLLVENGADVNAKLPSGMTPLMFAANKGFVTTVSALLKAGADPNLVDEHGDSSLFHAFQTELQRMFENRWEIQPNNYKASYILAARGVDPIISNKDQTSISSFCSPSFFSLLKEVHKNSKIIELYPDLDVLLKQKKETLFTQFPISDGDAESVATLVVSVADEFEKAAKEMEERPFCPMMEGQKAKVRKFTPAEGPEVDEFRTLLGLDQNEDPASGEKCPFGFGQNTEELSGEGATCPFRFGQNTEELSGEGETCLFGQKAKEVSVVGETCSFGLGKENEKKEGKCSAEKSSEKCPFPHQEIILAAQIGLVIAAGAAVLYLYKRWKQ